MRSATSHLASGLGEFLRAGAALALYGCAAPADALQALAPAEAAAPPALVVAPGDGRTLADAIAQALLREGDGARVVIEGGIFSEALVLDRPVVLEGGRARPQLRAPDGAGPTLLVTAPGVVLRRLVLAAPPEAEVLVLRGSEVTLEHCALVSEGGTGLRAEGGTARLLGCAVSGAPGPGLVAGAGARLLLEESEVVRCGTGVLVQGGEVRLHDSRVARCGLGGHVVGGGTLALTGGTFWTNDLAGVLVEDGVLEAEQATLLAPGGAPAVRLLGPAARALLRDCTLQGTPAEVDHHAGPTTREHMTTPIRTGTDHHLLGGLLSVEDGASLELHGGRLSGALGHGLFVSAGEALLEDASIEGSVFYNAFLQAGAEVVLRRCTLSDAGENGLFAWDDAGGLLEDCRVLRSGGYSDETTRWAGVVLADGARTTLRDCSIAEGRGAGLVVSGANTTPRLLRCEIRDHTGVGVSVSAGAHPELTDCRVASSGEHGLWVLREGGATLRGGAITDSGGQGAFVDQGGALLLERVRLAGGRRSGVSVWRGGEALLVDCDSQQNAESGAEAGAEGRLTLRGSRLSGNGGPGLHVLAGGEARVHACRLQDNGPALPDVAAGTSSPTTAPQVVVDPGGTLHEEEAAER